MTYALLQPYHNYLSSPLFRETLLARPRQPAICRKRSRNPASRASRVRSLQKKKKKNRAKCS